MLVFLSLPLDVPLVPLSPSCRHFLINSLQNTSVNLSLCRILAVTFATHPQVLSRLVVLLFSLLFSKFSSAAVSQPGFLFL